MNKEIEICNVIKVLGRKLPVILALLIITVFSANIFAQEQKTEPKIEPKPQVKIETPKILAVEFYADWCGNCKELMPKMAEIRKSYENKRVMVVRFDMTDDYTKAQASFMASYSGLGEVYKAGGGKTGFIALVDIKSKEILGVINKKKTPEEITKLIEDAITKAEATK